MANIADYLLSDGICALPEIYSASEIARINAAAEPLLTSRNAEPRAYVHPNEMEDLGIFRTVFSERMIDVLFSIMPDPALYHCHIYEIAANDTRSHIFAERLNGWHRDPDSMYVNGDATHVSIFIYLTPVGPDDGAFEFVPAVPSTKWLRNGTPFIGVQGVAGYAFAWHRNYYHRASPNRGPVRRRLIKLSIQRNKYPSHHLANPHFQGLLCKIPSGDVRMDLLLGRYQGKAAPHLDARPQPHAAPIAANGKLSLSSVELAKSQLRVKALQLKGWLRNRKSQVVAAYD